MAKERWLAVRGFEGEYAVSDRGRVMSMNFAGSGLPGIMATQLRRGYPSVMMRRKQRTVHSLVAAAFVGPRPPGTQVNHKNGSKADNVWSNLEYCTQSENMKHAHRIGLQSNKGEKHSRAKLNDSKVVDILDRLRRGEKQASIAAVFDIDQSQISDINTGRAWPHIPRKEPRKVG